jgi:hypothetical protein
MRKSHSRATLLSVAFIVLAVPLVVKAEANRTWVSGTGDDQNPCSRTSPCKTFAGAILQTVVGGEISVLDPGGFGAVNIQKSVTIDGGGHRGSILATQVNGVIVNLTLASDAAKTVRLRNLFINGMSNGKNGVKFQAGRRLFIDDVLIDGFDDHGILVEPMTARLFVNDTTIRAIGKSGIHVAPLGNTPDVAVAVNRTNLTGTFHALNVGRGSRVVIRDSTLAGNRQGFIVEKGEVTAVNCVLSENLIAINSRDKSVVRLSLVTVVNNEEGLKAANGGEIISFKNNVIHGNRTDGAPTSTIAP